MAKSELKGSSNPHGHFTEYLAVVFEEPEQFKLKNLKLFDPVAQDETGFWRMKHSCKENQITRT
jgi:hypothetical protein